MTFFSFLRENAFFLSAGALLTFVSSFGQTFFISLFAGEIRETFGLSHGAWGGIYMLGTMASAAVMIWAGSLTDIIRARALGPLVFAGLAASCLAMAFNPWVWALPFVIFALRFFGQGMSHHIAMVAMARWFVASRGKALSIAALGFQMGEALLPIVIVSLLAFVAWQSVWIAGAGVCLLAALLLARLLRLERTPQSLVQEDVSVGMRGQHWTRGMALGHPVFWCLVPAVVALSAFGTAVFFHQVHLAEIKGISHLALVSLFPLYTGVALAAMILSGWALDRLGTARLIPFYQIPLIAAFGIFALAQDPWTLALGFVFFGITSGGNSTLPNAFWAEFYGTAHIGAIKSLATAAMVLGSAIGPGLTGVLIDRGIGLETQFLWVAGLFAVITLALFWGVGRAARELLPAR